MRKALLWAAGLGSAAACFFFLSKVFSGAWVLPQEFGLGPLAVRFYGLWLAAGMLAGYFTARRNAWRFGLGREEADRLVFWSAVAALLGARLYFVLFEFEYFAGRPLEIIKVWEGGLSFFGGLSGGAAFLAWFAKGKPYSAWQVMDMFALSLPLAQAVGRFGNLFNYEAFGGPTDWPWKMFVPETFRPAAHAASNFFHPAFLYESLANLAIFALLYFFVLGRARPGGLALAYLAAYAAVRFFIEPLRVDSVILSGWRADQLAAAGIFLLALSAGAFRFLNRRTI